MSSCSQTDACSLHTEWQTSLWVWARAEGSLGTVSVWTPAPTPLNYEGYLYLIPMPSPGKHLWPAGVNADSRCLLASLAAPPPAPRCSCTNPQPRLPEAESGQTLRWPTALLPSRMGISCWAASASPSLAGTSEWGTSWRSDRRRPPMVATEARLVGLLHNEAASTKLKRRRQEL